MKKNTYSKIIIIICYIILCFTAAVAAGTVDPANNFTFIKTFIQEVICFAIIALCILISKYMRKIEKRKSDF